jgi:ABC-2 type transport system permease protein
MTRAFFVQFRRELGALLLSPIAYVVLLVVTILNAFNFLWAVAFLESGVKDFTIVQIFFLLPVFWFGLIPQVPLITMRLFADEYKTGTIEPLLTAPVREWDIILSKFGAAVVFFVLLWAPTALFVAVFQIITKNQVPIAWAPSLMSYGIILLVGMFYISIGIFASSLTKNQVIAAVLSLVVIIFLFFSAMLGEMARDPGLREIMAYIFTYEHVRTFSRGLFDTRPVVYYLSGCAFFLILTWRALVARQLKS